MADVGEILDSWEEMEDTGVLDKRLKGMKLKEKKQQKTAEVSILQEEGFRTQYAPQVKILKRQVIPDNDNKNASKAQATPQKTLQQREAEYKEARLRILGEDYSRTDNCNNNSTPTHDTRPIKLVKQPSTTEKVLILREPKGPDGTPGFDQAR